LEAHENQKAPSIRAVADRLRRAALFSAGLGEAILTTRVEARGNVCLSWTGEPSGNRYRAVFTNASGSATTNAATLTVVQPAMPLSRTTLRFAAVTTGSSFTASTPPQTVRLSQTGPGTNWTAASSAPWLVVSPASGTGSAILTIATQFVPGLGPSQSGQITLSFSGAGKYRRAD
jgi:hypothetical protein